MIPNFFFKLIVIKNLFIELNFQDELRQFKQELELAKNRNYDLSYRANWPWFDEKYDAHKDFKTKSKVSCLAYIISAYE